MQSISQVLDYLMKKTSSNANKIEAITGSSTSTDSCLLTKTPENNIILKPISDNIPE